MWTREELKKNAKEWLRNNLKKAVLACIIVMLLQAIFGGVDPDATVFRRYEIVPKSETKINSDNLIEVITADAIYKYSAINIKDDRTDDSLFEKDLPKKVIAVEDYLLYVIVGIVFLGSILVVLPLNVGLCGFFLKESPEISDIFYYFKNKYKDVLLSALMVRIRLILWYLLFILPGIYKYYQYIFTNYIIAENPGISSKEAIEISKEMTDDDKFNIFVLGISFFGWIILCILTFGLAYIFVTPYIEATFAKLYQKKKEIYENRKLNLKNDKPLTEVGV